MERTLIHVRYQPLSELLSSLTNVLFVFTVCKHESYSSIALTLLPQLEVLDGKLPTSEILTLFNHST